MVMKTRMRLVPLLIFFVLARLALPMCDVAGYFGLATLDIEPLTYSLLEQTDFEEELYINDIPFNTEKIAGEAHYKAALTVNFELEEENYVNDIPFNTASIAEMHNATASR